MNIEDRRYPRFARRLQAALYDAVIFGLLFFVCAVVFARFEVHGGVKIGVFTAIVFLLEPLLVSVYGSTIGHSLASLRVLDAHSHKNIGILRSTVRFVCKILLGWLSLIFVLTTRRRQALHDLFTHSSVVVRHVDRFLEKDLVRELPPELPGQPHHSKWRRVIMSIGHILLFYIVISLVIPFFISSACWKNDAHCNDEDVFVYSIVGLILLATIVILPILGWRGLLPGCRKRGSAAASSTE